MEVPRQLKNLIPAFLRYHSQNMNIFKLQDSVKGTLELVILTGFVCQLDTAGISQEDTAPVEELPPRDPGVMSV